MYEVLGSIFIPAILHTKKLSFKLQVQKSVVRCNKNTMSRHLLAETFGMVGFIEFFSSYVGSRYSTCSFAKKSLRKSRRDGPEASGDILDDKTVQKDNLDASFSPAAKNSNPLPSRSAVLQACIITSSLIGALGLVIRQVLFLLCFATSVSPFAALACFLLCCLS